MDNSSFTKLNSLTCPNCNAHFDIKPGQKIAYCTYCGSQLLVDDGSRNISITKRFIDDAAIERAKVERIRVMGQFEAAKRQNRLKWVPLLVYFGISFLLIVVASLTAQSHEAVSLWLKFIGINLPIIALLYIITKPILLNGREDVHIEESQHLFGLIRHREEERTSAATKVMRIWAAYVIINVLVALTIHANTI